jgi:hypothetical protein
MKVSSGLPNILQNIILSFIKQSSYFENYETVQHLVGLPGLGGKPDPRPPDIHVLSGIQTHSSSIQAAKIHALDRVATLVS